MNWRSVAATGLQAFAMALNAKTAPQNDTKRGPSWAGGHLSPPPQSVTRWYLADLERAIHEADQGDLQRASQLCRSLRRDGVLLGVLSTRTGGLVRLPKRYSGNRRMVRRLRKIFNHMFPAKELALLAADGILLGVAIGEMLPVEGKDYRVLRRLDPQYLAYRWSEGCWYYNSVVGPLKITPGDGRWILHCPGGEGEPWSHGLWASLGRSYIPKEHAFLHRENYSAKLANSARAAVAPIGATETQRVGFLQKVISWGVNTVFELPPGWDVKLIESNGRGYEVFADTMKKSDEEMIIAIAGQLVTTTGGAGFQNSNIHATIRSDLIQDTGEGLAHTLNTQGIPPWVNWNFGAEALEEELKVEWDTTPPKDMKASAEAISAAARAMEDANRALEPYGKKVDEEEMALRFAIPIKGDEDGDGRPDIDEDDLDEDGLGDDENDELLTSAWLREAA